ncbi:MAG: hypothetical protein M1816_006661 [Peltula sp. TS41687]|nr:MAG: hypothetical protein M1816_006661 [Peltula sp. TS41687]
MAPPNTKETTNGKPNEVKISVDDVLRLRDSLVTGLATLQTAVIAHTNALLSGNSGAALDLWDLTKSFGTNVAGLPRGVTPGAKAEGDGPKRKRNKKPSDPNAPKRPLTAYFLYLHSARPIIAKDLGDKATPGEVSNEATRRWAAMMDEEKELWKKAYQNNRIEYRERVTAYKAKLAETDPSAAQLALENDAAADGEEDEEDEPAEAELDVDVGVSAPPSPKSNKRRKTDKDASTSKNGAARPSMTKETPILPPTHGTEAVVPDSTTKDRKGSPEKSRRRGERERKSRGGDDGERRSEETEKEKRADREKRSRRKRKSDVIDEE